MSRLTRSLFCITVIAALCIPVTAPSAAETGGSLVLAQSGSNVKSFKKTRTKGGGESCTVQCKNGTSASQSCSEKLYRCTCTCNNDARCTCH